MVALFSTLVLVNILCSIAVISYIRRTVMPTLADLETASTAISTTVAELQTDVAALIAKGATIPQSVIDTLNTANTNLQAIDTTVKSA